MMVRDDVVTFGELEGFNAVAVLGTVCGSAARPRSLLRATFRSLGMLIGLAPGEVLSDSEQLRGDALDDLRHNAEQLGANAVVGLEFEVSEGPEGSCKVTASGRAIFVERTAAGNDRAR